MKIIIPRIPSATTRKELRSMVESVLNKKFHIPFTQGYELARCEIFSITDLMGVRLYYALLVVHPEETGSWLIKHLAGEKLHNKQVYCRQFFDRGRKDRSKIPGDERRRSGLQKDDQNAIHLDVSGYEQCIQEHKS